jgi:large subunit ribosomal protein L18
MSKLANKSQKRIRRHNAIRSRVVGTATVPRLAVFRSNKFMYAQLIDDTAGVTLCSASDIKGGTGTKTERASKIGQDIAGIASKIGITRIVFDRGGFKYIGRIQALADGARSGGLIF